MQGQLGKRRRFCRLVKRIYIPLPDEEARCEISEKRPFFAPFSEANIVLKANDFPRQALWTQTNIGKVESKKRSCRMDLVKRLMAGKVCENGLF